MSISIMDRNGMTETIGNDERLKQYENVDFLATQPYQKVLQIYGRDEEGNISSYVNSYHPNGQPKQYLEVVNSRALGQYREWHQNGVLKLESTVIGGEPDLSPSAVETWLFDNHARAWNENGDLIADISYSKGKLHGESLYYHDNGNVWKKIDYLEGQINGVSDIYLGNDMLLQSASYVGGLKHGESVRYWECGRIASKEEYNEGRLLSGVYYDIEANQVSEVIDGNGFRAVFGKESLSELDEIKYGIQEGLVKVFGTDKLVIRAYHVKNGIKHGEEIEYFTTPGARNLTKMSISWYENKIQGTVKTWYDNGKQESQREMSNNKKNGIATGWYLDGTLMLLEEYDQGKLSKGEYYRRKDNRPISVIKMGEGVATIFDSEGNFVRKVTYRSGVPLG
jgi:antitoxin component YwqK of YwqJK toxin-antitoxin module